MKNKTTFTNEELKVIGSCCYSLFKSVVKSAEKDDLSLDETVKHLKAVIEIKGVLDKIEDALKDDYSCTQAQKIIHKFSDN